MGRCRHCRQIATTHIEMEFVNDGDRVAEGTYLFPLPPGAAVTELTMWVDGQPIEANLLGAGKRGAFMTKSCVNCAIRHCWNMGTDAIQANVFRFRRVNRVVGSNTSMCSKRITDWCAMRSPIEQPIHQSADSGISASALNCYPTTRYAPFTRRRIRLTSRATVNLLPSSATKANDVTPDTDFGFVLFRFGRSDWSQPAQLQTTGRGRYILLLAAPSIQVDEVVAKDVLLVFDTSGSMEGPKLRQAQMLPATLSAISTRKIVSTSLASAPGCAITKTIDVGGNPGQVEQFIDGLQALGRHQISARRCSAVTQADPNRPTYAHLSHRRVGDGRYRRNRAAATNSSTNTPRVNRFVMCRIFAFGVGDDVGCVFARQSDSQSRRRDDL